MITIEAASAINANLSKFAQKFKETGDFKWLIRHAQEEALQKKFNPAKGIYTPITLGALKKALASQEVLANDDPAQMALNYATAKALRNYLEGLPPETKVLSTPIQTEPRKAFNPSVWPKDKKVLAGLNEMVKSEITDQKSLDSELRKALLLALDAPQTLENAINYLMSVAYVELASLNLYLNPILAFLPDERAIELAKFAAAHKNEGARLSDLIEALKISSGHWANKILQNNKKLAAGMLGIEEVRAIQKENKKIPQYLVSIAAYIDFLERASKSLNNLMANDPKAEWMRNGKDGPFITNDPFIQSDVRDPESFGDFLRKGKESKISLDVELWDGRKDQIKKFAPPVSDISKLYTLFEMQKPDFENSLAESASKNISDYKKFMSESQHFTRVADLKKIFTTLPSDAINKIYSDIVDFLKMAVVVPDDRAWLEAGMDPEEVRALPGADTGKAIRAYNAEQQESFNAAIDSLVEKYEGLATFNGDLYAEKMTEFLKSVIDTEVPTASPSDVRLLKEVPYADAIVPERIAEVSEALSEVFPFTHSVLKSEPFKSRYASNDEQYSLYEDAHQEAPNPELVSITDGVEKLKVSPILAKLGFQKDILALSSDENAFKLEYSKMANKIFSKSPDQLQDILKDIPLDSLYLYVGKIYTTGLEAYLACRIACRFAKGLKEESQKDEGAPSEESSSIKRDSLGKAECICKGKQPVNEASYYEAQKFIESKYLSTKLSGRARSGTNSMLSNITAGGRVAEWHQMGAKGSDEASFSKALTYGAQQGFGAHLDRENAINTNAGLNKNKKESEEAEKAGVPFVWNDPSNPKPRSRAELATLINAFADPIPGKTLAGGAERAFGLRSTAIEPGQRFTKEQLQALKDSGKRKPDDVMKALTRMIGQNIQLGSWITGSLAINKLREAFEKRREEILKIDPRYARDIIKFNKDKPGTENPFATPGLFSENEPNQQESARTHIGTVNDAIAFINSSVLEFITPHSADRLRSHLTGKYKDNEILVWKDNKEFAKYFQDELAPLLDGEEKDSVPLLLNRIYPGFSEIGRAVPISTPAPTKSTEPVQLVKTQRRPAKSNESAKITASLNTAIRQLDQILAESVVSGSDYDGLENQLKRFIDVDSQIKKQLRKQQEIIMANPDVEQMVSEIKIRLDKLGVMISNAKKTFLEAKDIMEAAGRQKLQAPIDQILSEISSPPAWPDKEIFEIMNLLTSLVNGKQSERVRAVMIKHTNQILGALLNEIKKWKAMPQEKRVKEKNFEQRVVSQLRSHLENVREGATDPLEEEDETGTSAIMEKEFGRGYGIGEEGAVETDLDIEEVAKPQPAKVPLVIRRK